MAQEKESFAQLEEHGWRRAAGRYESSFGELTKPFIPELLRAAGVGRRVHVLDVACGPGFAAVEARALGAVPIGVDFCPEMVRLARENSPEIPFHVGDAEALPFADASFHAVVMNFGVLHLPHPEKAFAEARRVLRPGGRYAFTVWAGPDRSPGSRVIEDAIGAHADLDVELPQGPDYSRWGDEVACREALARPGFEPSSVSLRTVTAAWRVPNAAFVFEAELHGGVRTAALLQRQKPAALSAIRSRLEGDLRAFADGGGLRIPFAAHVVGATAA